VAETGNDRLMVGLNRRFAPLLTQLKSQFGPACCTAIPLETLVAETKATFAVGESLSSGKSERV
jgi:hypothetical protein